MPVAASNLALLISYWTTTKLPAISANAMNHHQRTFSTSDSRSYSFMPLGSFTFSLLAFDETCRKSCEAAKFPSLSEYSPRASTLPLCFHSSRRASACYMNRSEHGDHTVIRGATQPAVVSDAVTAWALVGRLFRPSSEQLDSPGQC